MNSSKPANPERPGGMLGFIIVWAGQIVSVLATSMSQFVLTGLAHMGAVLVVFLFFPVVRDLEDGLPDHDQLEKANAA